MSVFKSYDIRGIYDVDFDKSFSYKLGYFLPELLDVRKILVGHDGRASSPEILEYFKRGVTDSGCDIYDMGLCSTPMVYFATYKKNFPGSVMITASHNDREYNGFKISRELAIPIGYDTGLSELKMMMEENEIIVSARKGKYFDIDINDEYIAYLKKFTAIDNELKISVDCSNGMAGFEAKEIFGSHIINGKIIAEYTIGAVTANIS